MRTQALCLCAIFLSLSLAIAEEPTYSIKIRGFPEKGQTLLCREDSKQTGTLRFIDSQKTVLEEQKPVEITQEVFQLSVLEEGDKQPNRYQQSYLKAFRSDGKRPQTLGYEGQTIGYEMHEGKYRLKLAAKADVTSFEKEALTAKANSDLEAPMDTIFQAERPVKVGEKWQVDGKLLRQGFGQLGKLDAEKTRGEACLLKAYQKDGKQFGVVEIDLVIAYTTMDELKFDPPALFHIKGTLDTAIDGSSNVGTLSMTSKLTGKTQIEKRGVKITLEIDREGTTVKERSPAK